MISWLKKHFIPHEGNDHRPHILRKNNIRNIAIAVIFLEIFTFLIPTLSHINIKGNMAAVLPSILTDLTNKERQDQKLNKLTVSPLLTKAAQMKADDMAQREYFAHTSPLGKTPWYWIESVGYKYKYAGENLAVNFTDSKDVTDAWMNSPTHKANIIKNKYTEIGTGISKGLYEGKETTFVVQMYGKPADIKPLATKSIAPVMAEVKENKNILGAETEAVKEVPTLIQKIEASPRNNVKVIFYIIVGIIALSLILNIFIKMKQHKGNLITNGLILIALVGAVLVANNYITHRQITTTVEKENIVPYPEELSPISLCYYRSDLTKSGFYDKAWLKLNLQGEKVTGEFQNLPAESDSKVGAFEGTAGPLDQKIMGRRADVWWDSRAEGMEVKEELSIEWGDGSATAGFGEMVDRGDGVYVYKDKNNLYYIKSMSQIDCEYLDEKLFVEKYIRDNISTIATNKPVLGGTWYVISANVIPSTKTGEVTYEDGHIQSKASFTYTYNKNKQTIEFNKFEVKK